MMKLSSCELERSDSTVDLNRYCPSPPSPYSHADSMFFGDHCPSSPRVCAMSSSTEPERSVSTGSAASATNCCRSGFLKRFRSDDFGIGRDIDDEGFDFGGDELSVHRRRKRCKVMESCTNSLKKTPTESSDDEYHNSEGYGCFVSSPARSRSGSENGEYGEEEGCDWGLVSPSRSVSSADVELGIADSGGSSFLKLVDFEEEQDRKMVKTPRKRFKYMEECDPSTWRDKALSLRANYFEAHGLFLNNNKTKKKKKNPIAAQATVTNRSNHGNSGSYGDRGNNDNTSPFERSERMSNLKELVDRKYGPSAAEDDNRAASLDCEEEQDLEVMKAPRKRSNFMKTRDYLNAHRGYAFDVGFGNINQNPSEKCEQVSKLKELMDRWSKLEEAQSQLNLDRVDRVQS